MNFLITGSTGFVGKHLAKALLQKGYSVKCLARKESDTSFLASIGVNIIYADLSNKDSLRLALNNTDVVYHLAGEVYARNKKDYIMGNVIATKNLVEISEEKNIKKIIFLSSIAVYKPRATEGVFTEESICEPITLYGKTKLLAEQIIQRSALQWIIVRAPVIYGPQQPLILNRFFTNIINNKTIYIIGDGEKIRGLCYIDNLVEGLALFANNMDVSKKIYIFSDESSYTFNEIVALILKISKQNKRVVHLWDIFGDIAWKAYGYIGKSFNLYFLELYAIRTMQLNFACDITKAKREIRYNPSVTLEKGIQNTIDWIGGLEKRNGK